jgi:hypothetical protein
MISIGGEVWASTEATDFWTSGQRSSVYAQIMTDTVGRFVNSLPASGKLARAALLRQVSIVAAETRIEAVPSP